MQAFVQFLIIGLGAGATYGLFAQGTVLIYRGSGIVNFAQGAVGTLAAYIAFVDLKAERGWASLPAIVVAVLAAALVSLLFQLVVLRALKRAAALVRVIATIGLLGLLQPVVEKRYGSANQLVDPFLPHDVFDWGGVRVQEERIYLVAITLVVTLGLWAWTSYTRVGLAIKASAQNERSVRAFGWSPDRLAALTWALGGALAGIAAVLAAPFTGLSAMTFTIVMTVSGLGAALLGGFESFPMTLVGGLVIGVGEAMSTLYGRDLTDLLNQEMITGLNRTSAFLVILVVVVVRGRALPLRSHVAERLPRLGSGAVNVKAVLVASGAVAVLLFGVMDDSWARATYTSLAAGVMILSIVVLTGYAGQISLAQWAFAGIGALIAGRLVRAGVPIELAILLGVVLTIPVGVVFAMPALRTRGVNLAVVTLALGFIVSEVVFANAYYLGNFLDGGTRIGRVTLFGLDVDAFSHPHAWAMVNLICFVLLSLLVANLRRSRTGRRLIAVRTNERAAAALGISVFGVKLYAFAVSAGLAATAGVLVGFRSQNIQYLGFNVFESITSMGGAVIGGLGHVVGAAFGGLNAVGGVGARGIENWTNLDNGWDLILGSLLLFVILIVEPHGIADVASRLRRVGRRRRRPATTHRAPLSNRVLETVAPATLNVEKVTVGFGGTLAVAEVSLQVRPGEVVGLIGPNGAGKTTLIDAITGFATIMGGSVSIDAKRIDRLNATQRARCGLRRSFQSLELFEDATVEENIRTGSDQGSSRLSWLVDLVWPGRQELTSAAAAAIHEFGLEADLDDFPDALPYGRRRLVSIARTVASAPSIVLLDEPAAGLDDNESADLARLIRRLADDRRMGVLLVEHDVQLVMSTCDRIVVLDFGCVIATGTPEQIRSDPAVRDAYLGHAETDSGGRADSGVPAEAPAVPPSGMSDRSEEVVR